MHINYSPKCVFSGLLCYLQHNEEVSLPRVRNMSNILLFSSCLRSRARSLFLQLHSATHCAHPLHFFYQETPVQAVAVAQPHSLGCPGSSSSRSDLIFLWLRRRTRTLAPRSLSVSYTLCGCQVFPHRFLLVSDLSLFRLVSVTPPTFPNPV